MRGHRAGHHRVVGYPVSRILVRPDIDAEHPGPTPAPLKPAQRGVPAAIVEPHAVDHCTVLYQPEQPRFRIAGLWQGRERADLDEPEPEPEQRVRHFGILVEPGGHAERVGKGNSGHFGCQLSSGRRGARWTELQGLDRQSMGFFRIERKQSGADQREQHRARL